MRNLLPVSDGSIAAELAQDGEYYRGRVAYVFEEQDKTADQSNQATV